MRLALTMTVAVVLMGSACGTASMVDEQDSGSAAPSDGEVLAPTADVVEEPTTGPQPLPPEPTLPTVEEDEAAPPPLPCVDWDAVYDDPTEALFQPDCVVDVNIEMDPGNWNALRYQTRDIIDVFYSQCLTEPPRDVFDWFEADALISGKQIYGIGIRKKGFYGSLSEDRPSLKLRFDRYVEGQRLAGAKRMTLNNMNQDPGIINTCLAYKIMTDAGLPAPRCSFARVHVNGEDLGLYAHVDAIKTAFLERNFGDATGNLYEGVLSDFTPLYSQTWEKKTNEEADDWSDIDAAIAALAKEDDELIDALSQVIDLNAFYTFWATEVLLGHWDGYAGNQNNFYIYGAPLDGGRFRFIPWGVDSAFFDAEEAGVFGLDVDVPTTVWAFAELSRRLYNHPTGRVGYANAIDMLLDEAWDEVELSLEIDRMDTLLSAHIRDKDVDFFRVQLEEKRAWINRRRNVFEIALATEFATWEHPTRASICWEDKGTLSGTFDTWWGTGGIDFFTQKGELANDVETLGSIGNVTANIRPGLGAFEGQGVLEFIGNDMNGEYIIAFMYGDLSYIEPGGVAPLDWSEWSGVLGRVEPLTFEFETIGILVDGTIRFDTASQFYGDVVTGYFDATVIQAP